MSGLDRASRAAELAAATSLTALVAAIAADAHAREAGCPPRLTAAALAASHAAREAWLLAADALATEAVTA